MQVETIVWDSDGWSRALPDLDSPSTLVLAFGDPDLAGDPRAIQELVRAYPSSLVMGCSTAGQIAGPTLRDAIWSVGVARFDTVRLQRATATVPGPDDSHAAGHALGSSLRADDLRAVFVLSDGLAVNGSELVRGLVDAVGDDVVISGGLAGDGDRFGRTWVVDGDAISSGRVVGVGLAGEALAVGTGSAGGWGIFGPERIVTRSEGNVLYELDGRPALEIYTRYLGELAAGLPASALLFPLAVRSMTSAEQVVRTVLAVDEANQSMTFAGDVPTGWRAQLMRSSPHRLVDGASCAAETARVDHAGPTLAVAISCVGRRLVLGARTEEELEATLDSLPQQSSLVGFYSYGEIAPSEGGFCELHNQTMTLTTFAEM
jgi:hypothetical protein